MTKSTTIFSIKLTRPYLPKLWERFFHKNNKRNYTQKNIRLTTRKVRINITNLNMSAENSPSLHIYTEQMLQPHETRKGDNVKAKYAFTQPRSLKAVFGNSVEEVIPNSGGIFFLGNGETIKAKNTLEVDYV